jgi:predicted dehydrogenase
LVRAWPEIPYSPAVGHKNWRLEATVGNGHLVDWGIHLIDAARNILGEKTPRIVNASGGIYELKGRSHTPDTLTAISNSARARWCGATAFGVRRNGLQK